MKTIQLFLCLMLTTVIYAQPKSSQKLPPSDIDYASFNDLTDEVEAYRQKRIVSLEKFLELSKKKGVMILDTRSKAAYDKKHVKGAVHLNFSDFAVGKLAKVIPSKTTTVLIYCNNNLDKDEMYFARKSTPLALNIPTFINLYGYGYKNIYELGALVPVNDGLMEFEGTAVKPIKRK